jgi:hypothetical protein
VQIRKYSPVLRLVPFFLCFPGNRLLLGTGLAAGRDPTAYRTVWADKTMGGSNSGMTEGIET